MTAHDLRMAHTRAVLEALATVHGIDSTARGSDSALAVVLGVRQQQIAKARQGGRSIDWLAAIAVRHRIAVYQDTEGRVVASVPRPTE